MDDLKPTVDVSPSLARRRALIEADKAHQTRVTDTHPLSKYMQIAERLFDYFQNSFDQLNLDEAFVYGVRLVHLGRTHLPKHKEWKIVGKNADHLNLRLGMVLNKLEYIKRKMDDEENVKMRERILAQNNMYRQQQQIAYNSGLVASAHGINPTTINNTKKKSKLKRFLGMKKSNKVAVQPAPIITLVPGGIVPPNHQVAPTSYSIQNVPVAEPIAEQVTLKLKNTQTPSSLDSRYAPESHDTFDEEEDYEKVKHPACTPLTVTPVIVSNESMRFSSENPKTSHANRNPTGLKSAQKHDFSIEGRPDNNEEKKKKSYQENQENRTFTTVAPSSKNGQTSMTLPLENRDTSSAKSNPTDSFLQNSAAEMLPTKHNADAKMNEIAMSDYSEHKNEYSNHALQESIADEVSWNYDVDTSNKTTTFADSVHTVVRSNLIRRPNIKDCLQNNYSKGDLHDPYDNVVGELRHKMGKMYTGHHVIVESNDVDGDQSPGKSEHSDRDSQMEDSIDINDFFDIFSAIISDIAIMNKNELKSTEFISSEEVTKRSMNRSIIHEINVNNIFAEFDSILSKMDSREISDNNESFPEYAAEEEPVSDSNEADLEYSISEGQSIQISQSNELAKPANGLLKNSVKQVVKINNFFSVFDEILSEPVSSEEEEKIDTESEEETNDGASPEIVVTEEAPVNEENRPFHTTTETVLDDDESYLEYTVEEDESNRNLQNSVLGSSTGDLYEVIDEETVLDDESYFEYTVVEEKSTRNLRANGLTKLANGSFSKNNYSDKSFDTIEEEIVTDDESYDEYTVVEDTSTINLQTDKLENSGNGSRAAFNVNNTSSIANVIEEMTVQDDQPTIDKVSQEIAAKEDGVNEEDHSLYSDDVDSVDEESIYVEETVVENRDIDILQTKELTKSKHGSKTKSKKHISEDKQESVREYNLVEDIINDKSSREIAAKEEAAYEKKICEDIVFDGAMDAEYTVAETGSLQSIELGSSASQSKHIVTTPSFKRPPKFQTERSLGRYPIIKVPESGDLRDDVTMITMESCLKAIDKDPQAQQDLKQSNNLSTNEVGMSEKKTMRPLPLESICEQGTSQKTSNHLNRIPTGNANSKNSLPTSSSKTRPSRFQQNTSVRNFTSVRVNNFVEDDDMTCITMDPFLQAIDDDPQREDHFKERIEEIFTEHLW
eukprot:CAMPEP_0197192432 /NCGR_PEP_ID=MMETSP1423-20130617/25050_1 /TAXON_ID=476441 /ORGANISM="Pseudo-nitzschia heimii, Strain UNC1101" /LENGTH=1175 /DNA_ID=CAMNT_0042645311 /DNA_START=82 /DNA_END=3606 /DNA_ORIENTATION=+